MWTGSFGVLAILFALVSSRFENLIQAVNILGSLFYGPILGIFLVAFFLKFIRGGSIFFAARMAQVIIIVLFMLNQQEVIKIAYLWYNLIGPALVILFSVLLWVVRRLA